MISFFFKTYGCQANVADSERLQKHLEGLGCSAVFEESQADLIVVNTCAVRDKAEQKLFSYLGRLVDYKKRRPFVKIGVIGCVASYKKKELYARFSQVNFVYGAREAVGILEAYLTDLVVSLETTKQLWDAGDDVAVSSDVSQEQDLDVKKIVQEKALVIKEKNVIIAPEKSVDKSKNMLFGGRSLNFGRPALRSRQEQAQPREFSRSFINIMTGCNKCCSYCIVPITRGKEISYPMSDIIDRVQHDVELGSKEVTLVGQNVNSYKDPVSGALFPELLRRVAEVPGDFWIRYVSPHPHDMTRDLFEVMAAYRPKVAGFVHFPLQSGSNKILEAMRRGYTAELYLEKIAWIRELLPGATISTDIIVGFPGETDADYWATREVMERVQFDLIYSFIYSPRKYTRALELFDDCPQEIKKTRLEGLQERQKEIALSLNQKNNGKKMRCLVEKHITNGKLLARTEGNIRVTFNGSDNLIDSFVNVTITSASPVALEGEVNQMQEQEEAA